MTWKIHYDDYYIEDVYNKNYGQEPELVAYWIVCKTSGKDWVNWQITFKINVE